ncbi:MAG: T9SS type A sorting domain-containing protein, partial [Bacteroidales bacterium]|nr:T9SS type A sorting domain-containing protein [Bacteroidales bacterium]
DSTAIITATANTAHRFLQWNDGNKQNPRTVTVVSDTSFTAIFEIMHTVNVSANDAARGTVTGSGDYPKDSTVIITATANTGHRFLQWNDGNKQNPRTVTVVSDTSFTAIFEIMHTVNVSANDVTRGSVTGSGDYPKDSTAIITATANTGHRFLQWNDGNKQNPRTVTVISDTSFTAIFEIMHTVNVSANDTARGSVTGSGDYAKDSSVTISATPHQGYRFVQWNDGNKQNPRSFTLTQDTAFTATFAPAIQNTYHLTATPNYPEMGLVTGSGDYTANATVTMLATPNTGYRFVQWNDGNTQNPRTVMVLSDTIFVAEFAVSAPNTYHVTVSVNHPSMGSVIGSGDYAVNSTVSIGAIANTGYRFVQWNDGNTQNPRTVMVLSDTIFMAEFAVSASNTYHVTVSVNHPSMGSVTGSGDYAVNSTVSIGAIANTGYRFVQWNDGNTQNPRSITVTQDTVLIAIFEQINAIEDIEASTISVYPNPAKDNIHVILPDNISNAVFTLYDIQGKMFIRKEIGNQAVVPVNNFAAGIYIYSVTTSKDKYTGKIVINGKL